MLTILDDLLLLSRLKENIGGARTETVSLSEMLEAALAAFKKEIEDRRSEGERGADGPPPYFGKQGIPPGALVIPAEQRHPLYPARRGRITLSLQENPLENKIIGTVTDTGIGIPSEEIPRIFEEFYRTKEAKSMQETGTGLGLCIVQQIVSSLRRHP